MSGDDVKAVAQKILDRAADQIGTHSTNCHEYHLACFAALVMREIEAATSAPAVDREELIQALIRARIDWHGTVTHESEISWLADAAIAHLGARNVRDVEKTPAVDREALVEVLARADALSDEQWSWREFIYGPQVDALLASGLLRDVRDVQAEALEQLVERVTDDGLVQVFGGEKFVSVPLLVSEAQAIREARNE